MNTSAPNNLPTEERKTYHFVDEQLSTMLNGLTIALGSAAFVVFSAAIALLVALPSACDYPNLFLSFSATSLNFIDLLQYMIAAILLIFAIALGVADRRGKPHAGNFPYAASYHIQFVTYFCCVMIALAPVAYITFFALDSIKAFPRTPTEVDQKNFCAKRTLAQVSDHQWPKK